MHSKTELGENFSIAQRKGLGAERPFSDRVQDHALTKIWLGSGCWDEATSSASL